MSKHQRMYFLESLKMVLNLTLHFSQTLHLVIVFRTTQLNNETQARF